ncbi:MAG: cyclic nucleotide-binding domain-containing protein [Erysipelotrichaceae bacterium]|nr:cyclic nucleotide-binding domain-containing protein [Erysipelotrichaceae bacterium]
MKHLKINKEHHKILSYYGLDNIDEHNIYHLVYESGESIFVIDEKISYFLIVLKGRAKAYRLSDNGRSLIIKQYFSKGVIGVLELVANQSVYANSMTAISDFECLAIPFDICREELKKNIVFSNRLSEELADKLIKSSTNYFSSALHSGEQRLCSYIIEFSENSRFRDNMSEVASMVGISYRHMYRILNDLCEDKVLKKDEKGYLIINEKELYNLSGKEEN